MGGDEVGDGDVVDDDGGGDCGDDDDFDDHCGDDVDGDDCGVDDDGDNCGDGNFLSHIVLQFVFWIFDLAKHGCCYVFILKMYVFSFF